MQLVDFGFGLFDLGDEVFLVVEEYFLNRIKKVDGQKAHIGTFVLTASTAMPGVASMSLGSRYWAPSTTLWALSGRSLRMSAANGLTKGRKMRVLKTLNNVWALAIWWAMPVAVMAISSW